MSAPMIGDSKWDDAGNLLVWTGVEWAVYAMVGDIKGVQVTGRIGPAESPCRNCERKNDAGEKACWWCECPDPTGAR